MKKRISLFIAAGLMAGLMIGAPMKAMAQVDPRDQIIPSLELDQADVREALRLIFKSVNVQYTIAGDVQGTVTVSLKSVPFETALRNVLNQVGATYRVEGGIYNIVLKKENADINPGDTPDLSTTQPKAEAAPVKIRIRHADPALIFRLLQGVVDPYMQPEMSTSLGGGAGGGSGFGGSGGFGNSGFGGGSSGFGGGSSGFGGGGFGGGGFGGGFSGGGSGFGGGGGGARGGF